jgi:hypothetical protein
VAVLVVLVLAAVLQTDEDASLLSSGGPLETEPAAADEPVPPAAPEEGGEDEQAVSERIRNERPLQPDATGIASSALPEDVERRAAEDFRRLARHRSRWTLQLALVCDPENVRKLLRRTGAPDELFVVPADFGGRDCYRVCWGLYPSRDEAAAGGLPPGLPAGEIGAPDPKQVAVVAP